MFGSKAKFAHSDELVLDPDTYLSEIDNLDEVAANETCVSLTSGSAAVEQAPRSKSNQLFPHSPKKATVASKIVVVRNDNSTTKSSERNHRKSNDYKPDKRSRQCGNSDENRSNRPSLQVAIQRAKDKSAQKNFPPRLVGFIANPLASKTELRRKKDKKPVFARVGPVIANPLHKYTIPKPRSAKSAENKPSENKNKPPKVAKPCESINPKPANENKPAALASPRKLSRTQIKNRNRRAAYKKLRDQQKQQQQN